MDQPTVKVGDCIYVGDVKVAVLRVAKDGEIYAGYYQRGRERNRPSYPVKEVVHWKGKQWAFKSLGPDASYVTDGHEESMIRKCHK